MGGVIANLLAAKDSSIPNRAILPASGQCGFGVAQSTVAAGGSVIVTYGGTATLVADNNVAQGDLIGGGTVTPGRGADLFQQINSSVSAGTCIVGRAQTAATVGNTFTILLQFGVGTASTALAPVAVPNSIPVNTSGGSTRPAIASDVTTLFSCSSGFLDSTGSCSFPTKLTGQAAITPGTILDGNIITLATTVTVTGASPGNLATIVGVSPALPAGTKSSASVSSANTVSIAIENQSGISITPAATTFTVTVDTSRVKINCSDFGCVGDGVTDTTATVTNAINAVCANPSGGILTLGSGTFYLNSYSVFSGSANSYHNLPMCGGLEIDGQGIGQTILLQGPSGIEPTTGGAAVLAPPYYGSDPWLQTTGPGAANGAWYALNAVTAGDTCETATTVANAANFPIGAYVYLANFWSSTPLTNYVQSEPNIVKSSNASSGQICFQNPIARTFTAGVFSATYVSGGTAPGSGTGTCVVGNFTGGGANSELASAVIAYSSGTLGAITMVQGGYSFTSSPTGAALASPCSGSIVITSTLASAFIRNVTPTTTHNVTLKNLTVQGTIPIAVTNMWWVNGSNVNLLIDTTNSINAIAAYFGPVSGLNFNNVNLTCVGTAAACTTTSPARLSQMQLFARNGANSTWSNSVLNLGGILLGSENPFNLSFINDTMTGSSHGVVAQGANTRIIGGTVNAGGVSGVTYVPAFGGLVDGGGNIPGDYSYISGTTVNCNGPTTCVSTSRQTSSLTNMMINVTGSSTNCGTVQASIQDGLIANQTITGNICNTAGTGGWIIGGNNVGQTYGFNFSNNQILGTGGGTTGISVNPTQLLGSASNPIFANNIVTGFTNRITTNANTVGAAITSPMTDVLANVNRYSAPVILTNITAGSNPCTVGSSTGLATPSGSPGSYTWSCQ